MASGVTERRRQQQQPVGVRRCGEGRFGGGSVVAFALRSRGFTVSALGFLSLSLSDSLSLNSTIQNNLGFLFVLFRARCMHTARGKFWIFFFFFLNRINLINGLVQTFGFKQVITWAIMGLNKYCYLGFLFLSMINWVYYIRVFTNYFRVFTIFIWGCSEFFFFWEYLYKFFFSFDFFKSQGVQLHTLALT